MLFVFNLINQWRLQRSVIFLQGCQQPYLSRNQNWKKWNILILLTLISLSLWLQLQLQFSISIRLQELLWLQLQLCHFRVLRITRMYSCLVENVVNILLLFWLIYIKV